jgi:DNA-binding NarL/FixJ family response regulator
MDKKQFEELTKKLDILIVIQLANAGLGKGEIASVIGTSEKTIQRMLPFNKVKKKN